jgi:hypothetical protein
MLALVVSAEVSITEDPQFVLTEPLPTRIRSPRTAQHAGLLRILDQRLAVTSRAREARTRIQPGRISP